MLTSFHNGPGSEAAEHTAGPFTSAFEQVAGKDREQVVAELKELVFDVRNRLNKGAVVTKQELDNYHNALEILRDQYSIEI